MHESNRNPNTSAIYVHNNLLQKHPRNSQLGKWRFLNFKTAYKKYFFLFPVVWFIVSVFGTTGPGYVKLARWLLLEKVIAMVFLASGLVRNCTTRWYLFLLFRWRCVLVALMVIVMLVYDLLCKYKLYAKFRKRKG